MKKIAVICLNLGGPDSKNAIKPFLMNFFMDKNIIRLPIPFRCFVAALISNKRTKREAGESYHELGDKSPLLENTKAQAAALEESLNESGKGEFKTFVCMRYWHPMAPQVVREVRDWGADEIVLLPFYPQYSTTTTRSSLQVWEKSCFEAGYEKPTTTICCYPKNEGYAQASVDNIVKAYKEAEKKTGRPPRVLFSAHGLPESVIKDGDPYQWQCEQSAQVIAERLSETLENSPHLNPPPSGGRKERSEGGGANSSLDWSICYQSRVGPQKWIGPSTEEALKKAAEDKVPVIVYPHAFTQEHVETLVEIEIEYREMAEEWGVPYFSGVKTVGEHPAFIGGLREMVLSRMMKGDVAPDTGENLCGSDFCRCAMKDTAQIWKHKQAV